MTTGLLLAVGFLVVLGIGFLLGRYLSVKAAKSRIAKLTGEAEELLENAQERVASAEAAAVRELEANWQQRADDLEEEGNQLRKKLERARQKHDKRRRKLDRQRKRLKERARLLSEAIGAVDALRRETEEQQRAAEELLASSIETSKQVSDTRRLAENETERAEKLKQRLERQVAEYERLNDEHVASLERISGISRQDAKTKLEEQLFEKAQLESASRIKELRDEARLTANREVRRVILAAMQRTAAGHAIENTVSVVNLESDEMKGRIIGREGRNIRAFEAATGVEVIVDDTPEAVILSGFDPVRREIARISLEQLIEDGRIHPARVEEVVQKVTEQLEDEIMEIGERTVIDLGLHGLHPELTRLVGRMRYRTSYGQNLLAHSIEVAKLSSIMAAELNLDAAKARRAGLLHDIGKVVEGDLESPHALVGMDLCRKFGEHDEVCNAVGAHHDEIEMTSLLSPLVQSADAISGARPGARREALESYIKRLENLERLAGDFNGVDNVYAIQAGRELRVIVNHELVSDAHAEQLAADISKKIEDEMQYPGQIKITVIRELRSVSYAR